MALNSRLRIVVYADWLSLFAATAAPKYRPDWAAAAPRVDSAACARVGSRDTVRAATTAAIPITDGVRSRRPAGRGREAILILQRFKTSDGGLVQPPRPAGRWLRALGIPV